MVRPCKPAKCTKHSVSLSPDSQEIIERGGFQTNLSAFIDGLIRHTSADSPIFIGIKIERLGKDIAKAEESLLGMRTERDVLQAQLNIYKQRSAGEGEAIDAARLDLLRKWDSVVSKDSLRGEHSFRGWLTGPANAVLIRDCGFQDADAAVAWCRDEARRR
jgi:hypothetical protein